MGHAVAADPHAFRGKGIDVNQSGDANDPDQNGIKSNEILICHYVMPILSSECEFQFLST